MKLEPNSNLSKSFHEEQFVGSFIIQERRQRWLEGLAKPKQRRKILSRLADSRDFVPELMHHPENELRNRTEIATALRRAGASETCYIMSEVLELDQRFCKLEEAIEMVFGIGLGSVLSCIPGHLAFYEAEPMNERWFLAQSIHMHTRR